MVGVNVAHRLAKQGQTNWQTKNQFHATQLQEWRRLKDTNKTKTYHTNKVAAV